MAVTTVSLLLAGCSGGTASHDPVFESTQVREVTGPDCPGSVLCVTVTATVELPGAIDVRQLNVVCGPMIEG